MDVAPALFIKNVHPSFNELSKISCANLWVYFCVLCSVPLIYVSVPLAMPCCPTNYRYIVSLEAVQIDFSYLILFQNILAVVDHLPFLIHFRIILSMYTNIALLGFFYRNCVVYQFKENWHLYYMLSLPIHDLHLFRSSLISFINVLVFGTHAIYMFC